MATTYLGVDVSENQVSINWATMQSALGSNGFVLIRAGYVGTSGGIGTDALFYGNQSAARARNIKRAFYFYVNTSLYVGRNGTSDADAFVNIVGGLLNGEIMVLDFDLASGGSYAAAMDTYAFNFISEVIARYSSANLPSCILYSSQSLLSGTFSWQKTASLTFAWIANYGSSDPPGQSPSDWSETISSYWDGQDYPGSVTSFQGYCLLQYSSKGTGSTYGATSAHIDKDSFYSLNNTINDWNLFGYKGGGGTGILTFATSQTNPIITTTEPELLALSIPQNSYDKIIYSNTIYETAGVSAGIATVGPFSTGVGQSAFPLGNFSVDGGNTWNDYGFLYGNDTGLYWFPLGWTDQQWVVQPYVKPNGDLYFKISYPNGGGAAANFIFHIALLAIHNDTLSLPQSMSQIPNITQKTAFSNVVPGVTPAYATYRRIGNYVGGFFSDHDIAFSGNTTGSGDAHGLGTIPNILFYQYDTSNDTNLIASAWSSTGPVANTVGIALDSQYISVQLDGLTNNVVVRFYQDN